MPKVRAALLVVLVVAGCSMLETQTTQERRTDQEMAAAGFRKFPADTPEKMARLRTLTPLRFNLGERAGKPYYTLADPDGCRCLWVGGRAAYQRLQDLEIQREISSSDRAIVRADRKTVAVEDTPGDFDPFDPAFFPGEGSGVPRRVPQTQ
jgi:hypothetical protein